MMVAFAEQAAKAAWMAGESFETPPEVA